MRRALLLLMMLATQVQAGAWPREKGHAFLSASGQFEIDQTTGLVSTYSTFYGEYGLTDKLTIGVDLGGSGVRSSKAIGFFRLPLADNARGTKVAAEFGIGLVENRSAIRPGLSLGRGLMLGKRRGWVAIDARGVIFGDFNDLLLETDLTFGWAMSTHSKVILQLQAGSPAGQPTYMRFAPSVIFEYKPGRHIELGVATGLKNASASGIKLGTWFEF